MSKSSFSWCGCNLHRIQFQAVSDKKTSLLITRIAPSFNLLKQQPYTVLYEDGWIIIGSSKYPETWIKASKISPSGEVSFFSPKFGNKLESISSNDFAFVCDIFYWIDPYIIGYIFNVLNGK